MISRYLQRSWHMEPENILHHAREVRCRSGAAIRTAGAGTGNPMTTQIIPISSIKDHLDFFQPWSAEPRTERHTARIERPAQADRLP